MHIDEIAKSLKQGVTDLLMAEIALKNLQMALEGGDAVQIVISSRELDTHFSKAKKNLMAGVTGEPAD